MMGLSDAAESVLPKVALLATPRAGGSIASRFYVPWNCHVAHSTSGALCVAAATRIAGTVAAELSTPQPDRQETTIEHPSGFLTVRVETKGDSSTGAGIARAGVKLTARPLFDGLAYPRPYHS